MHLLTVSFLKSKFPTTFNGLFSFLAHSVVCSIPCLFRMPEILGLTQEFHRKADAAHLHPIGDVVALADVLDGRLALSDVNRHHVSSSSLTSSSLPSSSTDASLATPGSRSSIAQPPSSLTFSTSPRASVRPNFQHNAFSSDVAASVAGSSGPRGSISSSSSSSSDYSSGIPRGSISGSASGSVRASITGGGTSTGSGASDNRWLMGSALSRPSLAMNASNGANRNDSDSALGSLSPIQPVHASLAQQSPPSSSLPSSLASPGSSSVASRPSMSAARRASVIPMANGFVDRGW